MADDAQVPAHDGWLHTSAALGGTLPVALCASICMARYLPLELSARFAVGFLSVIPLWVAAMCVVWLARTGARAWQWCAAATLVLGAVAFGL